MLTVKSVDKKAICNAVLEKKIEFSKNVIRKSIYDFEIENIGIAITGGKDSTLSLWLLKEVCQELNLYIPKCMFIDEGDAFTLVDLGKGSFLLTSQVSRVAHLGDQVARLMEEEGVALDEILEALDEEREAYYHELYVRD